MAPWAMCFGLGRMVKSGTTPNFIHTCAPLIPSNGDATDLLQLVPPDLGALDREATRLLNAYDLLAHPYLPNTRCALELALWPD